MLKDGKAHACSGELAGVGILEGGQIGGDSQSIGLKLANLSTVFVGILALRFLENFRVGDVSFLIFRLGLVWK